jgi:transcriptional regulator with XRE-family HTH domain
MRTFDPSKVKELREQHRLTLGQFALFLPAKVKRQHVHAWEKGKYRPGIVNLEAMASAFGVPIEYFFVESESASTNMPHTSDYEANQS